MKIDVFAVLEELNNSCKVHLVFIITPWLPSVFDASLDPSHKLEPVQLVVNEPLNVVKKFNEAHRRRFKYQIVVYRGPVQKWGFAFEGLNQIKRQNKTYTSDHLVDGGETFFGSHTVFELKLVFFLEPDLEFLVVAP